MTQEEIAERIEHFIRAQFAVSASDLRFNRAVDLFENGYVDSIGVAELLAFIGGTFEVRVPDEDLLSDDFSTIAGMSAIVERLSAT